MGHPKALGGKNDIFLSCHKLNHSFSLKFVSEYMKYLRMSKEM